MQSYHFTCLFAPEEGGGYHVFCPALQGCQTYGDTIEEATANIKDAIKGYLQDMKACGEEIPVEHYLITWVSVEV